MGLGSRQELWEELGISGRSGQLPVRTALDTNWPIIIIIVVVISLIVIIIIFNHVDITYLSQSQQPMNMKSVHFTLYFCETDIVDSVLILRIE